MSTIELNAKAMLLADQCQGIGEADGWPQLLEAAAAIRRLVAELQARAQVQGAPSWWMRETAEGAEWTDTAPLVLSGWTPLYTQPQPAQATQAEVTDSMIRESFLANGFTIKDGHSDLKPYVYAAARAILAMRPERVPMTEDQVRHNDALMSANGTAGFKMDALMRIVRATEAHHFGITIQPKGGE